MNKKVLLAGSILAVLGIIAAVLIYIFVYNKPQPDFAKEKADYTVKAAELFSEFKTDAKDSNTRYTGKVVAITGKLTGVEKTDSLSIAVFALQEGMFGDEGIRCALIPEHANDVNNISPGTEITLKGYCTGFNDTDVIMEHCSLVK
ncbi:MAG: OB-fold protein [Chloroflexota bacterium]|nr:hypothetical protein [Lentimicrobium sp.]